MDTPTHLCVFERDFRGSTSPDFCWGHSIKAYPFLMPMFRKQIPDQTQVVKNGLFLDSLDQHVKK